ncbi:MAG: hypothetical protein JNL60_14740 [Bacteroidia bacterium]|nr:hypothetical protein [Bacteroidia bacterium]
MKKKNPAFKKHILIPLGLCLLIVMVGIYMTISDTVSYGRGKEYRYGQDKRNAVNISLPITGPQAIAVGLIMASVVTYIWWPLKK